MTEILRAAFRDFREDGCPRIAAAMSYFTVFSLPPLLLVVMLIAGLFFDPGDVSGRVQLEMTSLIGPAAAGQIDEMMRSLSRPAAENPMTLLVSAVGLFLGSTAAFNELQDAMNRIWEVRPDPARGGVTGFVEKRFVSAGIVLAVAFLLLVSLLVSAALSALGDRVGLWASPGDDPVTWVRLLNFGVSLGVVTVLFALLFAYVPDARIDWSDVWFGAFATAVLFTVGKFLLGLYFARSDPGAAFGAAGSLALVFAWVYYNAMILFFGAELTQAWSVARGAGIRPEDGAVRVVERPPVRVDGSALSARPRSARSSRARVIARNAP